MDLLFRLVLVVVGMSYLARSFKVFSSLPRATRFELKANSDMLKLNANPLIHRVNGPSMVNTGMTMQADYVVRPDLIGEIVSRMSTDDPFMVLSDLPGTGKTSTFTLLKHHYASEVAANSVKILSLPLRSGKSAYEIVKNMGLDLDSVSPVTLPDSEKYSFILFILDECHLAFKEVDFWKSLLTCSWKLPKNVKFLLLSTKLVASDDYSIICFKDYQLKTSLLFNATQCKAMVELTPEPIQVVDSKGERVHLSECPDFMDLLIRDTRGHVGAIRCILNTICELCRGKTVREEEVIAMYLGHDLHSVDRCFGPLRLNYHQKSEVERFFDSHEWSTVEQQQPWVQLLINDKVYYNDGTDPFMDMILSIGILQRTKDSSRQVGFVSPLAQRYFRNLHYPRRACREQYRNLKQLVLLALQEMSTNVISHQWTAAGKFPVEVTQQELKSAILTHTLPITAVCCEFTRWFPESESTEDQEDSCNNCSTGVSDEEDEGRLDLLIDGGKGMYGVELLINGRKVIEHSSRFAPSGKYAGLKCKDWIVLDFRPNKNSSRSEASIGSDPHRCTVLLTNGDSALRVKWGDEEWQTVLMKP